MTSSVLFLNYAEFTLPKNCRNNKKLESNKSYFITSNNACWDTERNMETLQLTLKCLFR